MLDATLSMSGRVFPGDGLVGEACACVAIDIQAPRFTPSGERIWIEKDGFDDHPVLDAFVTEVLGLLAPLRPGAGQDLAV